MGEAFVTPPVQNTNYKWSDLTTSDILRDNVTVLEGTYSIKPDGTGPGYVIYSTGKHPLITEPYASM